MLGEFLHQFIRQANKTSGTLAAGSFLFSLSISELDSGISIKYRNKGEEGEL